MTEFDGKCRLTMTLRVCMHAARASSIFNVLTPKGARAFSAHEDL